jgi:peptidoglycan/LPS O-acetylase OafA/YrhL
LPTPEAIPLARPAAPDLSASGPIASGRAVDRLAELDGVRGIAALVVVVHHCLLTQPAFSNYFFSNWTTQAQTPLQHLFFDTPARLAWAGYEAVILFYVLSGLVLALPWLDRRPPSYRVFIIKRACRIYLPYLAAVTVAAVLSFAFTLRAPIAGLSDWVNTMNWSWPVTSLVVINHVFLTGHHNVLDGPIHSLVWEMRVSALFPFIVIPIIRWGWRGAAGVAAAIVALIALIQVGFSGDTGVWRLLTVNPGLGAIGKLSLEVEWTAFFGLFFVIGTLLLLVLRHPVARRARLPGVALALTLGLGLFIIQLHWSHLELVQDLMVGVGSCLVILACGLPGFLQRALSGRVPAWLGSISYSLYLVHVPLLMLAVIVLHGRVPVPGILLAILPTSILAAWGFDRLVTKPCARLGRHLARRGAPGRQPAAAPGYDVVAERS